MEPRRNYLQGSCDATLSSMNKNSILILGATGLVGSEILLQLKRCPTVKEIFVLTRRPLAIGLKDDLVLERIVDFNNLDEQLDCFSVDTVICALGSTIKKAGSQEEFRKIDFSYPLKIARIAKSKGARQFLLVSSLGADEKSKIFYNRTKGELESDLQKIGFESLVIVRPSILLGERAEVRIAESIGQNFSKILPRRWRGVSAALVAQVLVHSIGPNKLGLKIIENSEIFEHSSSEKQRIGL